MGLRYIAFFVILVLFSLQTSALLTSRAKSIQSLQEVSRRTSSDLDLSQDPEGKSAVVSGGKIHVRIVLVSNQVDKQALLNSLSAFFFDFTGSAPFFIEGYLSIDFFEDASSLSGVKYLDVTYTAVSRAGLFEGEGAVALRADKVTSRFGVSGNGIKFGVISTSFNISGSSTSNTDLPDVQVIADTTFTCNSLGSGCDEGRAMIEVMYDIAPNASYAFATGLGGEARYATNLLLLAANGCQITVDDLFYLAEPVFQPGVIEQAIAANFQENVYHFSAASNFGNQGYYEKFRSRKTISYLKGSTQVNDIPIHQFPNGQNYVEIQSTTFVDLVISLQWNQAFASLGGNGARTDLDVVFSERGVGVDSARYVPSTSNQEGADAMELWFFSLPSSSTLRVYIANANEGPNPVFHLKIYSSSSSQSVLSFSSFFKGPTSVGHCASEYAIAVGASDYSETPPFGVNPPKLEFFSSSGGLPRYFDLEQRKISPVIYKKPDFVGPDGIVNSFFGQLDDFGSFRFYGTSCAAPAVAALGGLIMELRPTISFKNLRNALRTKPYLFRDQLSSGKRFNFEKGYGYVNGLAAAKAVV